MPSIALPVSLRGQLLSGSKFSPYSLFTFGTQGIWLDPSDVANLAWRRNLLTYSEQFDNAAWSKAALLPVVANSSAAPDGTTTADTILPTTASDFHYIAAPATTVPANVQHIVSFYAKDAGYGFVRYYDGVANNAVYTLAGAGAVTGSTGGVATITSVGNGWYRCTKSVTPTTSTINCFLYPQNVVGSVAYAGSGTSGIYLWGAQLELGSVATDYQRISDVNTEVIERFPNATMYQDAAGTTAVTTPGQPVGLRLDKSKGLALGAELVANGDFSAGTTGWTLGTGWAISGGVATHTGTGPGYLSQGGLTAGRTYRLTVTITATDGRELSLIGAFWSPGVSLGTTVGTRTVTVTALSGTMWVYATAAGTTLSIDNISVRELAGNHATQSVLASRPVYGIEPAGGRRNLLTFSEVFSDSAWIKASGAAITANTDTAPNGTLTADTLTTSGVPSFSAGLITQAVSVAATGVTFTFSAYLKASSTSKATIWLNLAGGAERVAVVVNLTSSYQRYTVSATFTSGSIVYPHVVAGDANLGTNAGSVFIWGAQLELGSTATAYQRVTSAFDVTEAGVQSCHYVQYDGSDDGMITNSIDFTATDKMSVFAGVRRQSATTDIMLELSADAGGNNGAFHLAQVTAPLRWQALSKGTIFALANAAMSAAPASEIASSTSDIGGDRVTLRVNGVQAAQTTTDQGTGNYGNYRLNIGRRGNDQVTPTLPFNGRDYGIVVVGKATTADEITSTERWLSGKTGFYAPIITGVPTIGVS